MEESATNNDDGRPILSYRYEVEAAVKEFLSSPTCDSASARDFAILKPRLEHYLAKRFGHSTINEDQLTYTDIGQFARDYGSVILFNRLHINGFLPVQLSKRAIFLPHCLQNRRECNAQEHPHFSRCVTCGSCKIEWLVNMAREYGYLDEHIYIVGGGSGIPRIVKKDRIQAVLGLACYTELASYLESFRSDEGTLPSQMILLTKWGCRNTEFDSSHAREVFLASLPFASREQC